MRRVIVIAGISEKVHNRFGVLFNDCR